jgi:hypothetical protein
MLLVDILLCVLLEIRKAVPDRIGFDPSKPSVDVDVPLKTENQIGPIVTHSFTVLNNGPSAVSQSRLSISWPLFLRQDSNSSQSYLLYILDVDVSYHGLL